MLLPRSFLLLASRAAPSLSPAILSFQGNAGEADKHKNSDTQRGPGQQNSLCGIRCAIDGVKGSMKGGIVTEERAAVYFVAVQTE